MNRIELLMATAAVALLSACGGGGGGEASPAAPAPNAPVASSPAPAPGTPARSYKMRIFGLVAGQYPLTCTQTGSSSNTSEQLTIGMTGELQLGGRTALSFALPDALGSSLGNLRCTVGASPIASAHQYAVANGRLTLVSSSGVTGSTSVSIDLRDSKVSELLQAPVDQANPSATTQDNFAYSLKLRSGLTMDLSRYATDGIVRLAVQSPGAERVACERSPKHAKPRA